MGWIAKTLAIIGIIFLIIIIIAGITVYQVVGLIKTVKTESSSMQTNMEALTKGDCSKLSPIESSFTKIKLKAENACWNPIIRIAVNKMDQVTIKCKDISALESQMTKSLAPIELYCANQTKQTTAI
jgi:hypothetical protein